MLIVNRIKKLLSSNVPTFGRIIAIKQNGEIEVATTMGLKSFPPNSKLSVGEPVRISGDTLHNVIAEKTIWLP